jgi:hypothetical protein
VCRGRLVGYVGLGLRVVGAGMMAWVLVLSFEAVWVMSQPRTSAEVISMSSQKFMLWSECTSLLGSGRNVTRGVVVAIVVGDFCWGRNRYPCWGCLLGS